MLSAARPNSPGTANCKVTRCDHEDLAVRVCVGQDCPVFVGSAVGWVDVAGFATGLLISVVTAPVGVSGAVFLLPVQVSLGA
jgi:hypothetical protein